MRLIKLPDYADTLNPDHASPEQLAQRDAALNAKPYSLPPPGHPGSPFAITRRPWHPDDDQP